MKLCYFDDYRIGIVRDDIVIDASSALAEVKVRSREDLMTALIADFVAFKPRLEALALSKGIPLSTVKLRAPLPAPRTIVCMAVNYDDGLITSPHVNAFHKTSNAIIGPDEKMVLPDAPASVFEGEAEMAVVIGKRTENVSPEEAMDYVFGYMNFIDGSARDLLPATNSFFQMKSRRTFAPIGPYIVTSDEIADPQNLNVKLWVNGVLKQDFNTAKMVTNIRNSIAWISAIQTLEAGDLIATGTDHCGLNAFQHDDLVELETQGLGRLRIGVQDDLKRTWSRETRIERHKKGLKTIAPQLSGKYAPEQPAVNN